MWVSIGSGEGKGLSVRVEGERFLVGTGPECQLMLGDTSVAPLHAYFEVGEDGRVALHDLGSEGGTFVNGERIEGSRAIEGGEEIRIGDTLLVPSVADPAEEARDQAEHAREEPENAPAVRVRTDDGQTVEVLAAGDGDEEGHAAVRVATEGEAVEVVPAGEHRRLRDRVRVATALAAGAGLLALIGLVVFLATRGEGKPSPAEITADAKKRTVLVKARIPGGTSTGTGFVLDAGRGLVVTNFHVVNGGSRFSVGVGGNLRTASIAGAAPCDDLAVLHVGDNSGMETFPLGSQGDLKQGEQVVAVGYPASASLDDNLSSTAGVVSRVSGPFRAPSADAPSYPNVVQTDAALNPGNSGGPLIDERKKLVGVNAATVTSLGGQPIQGQGYAIGVDRVKEVVRVLRVGHSRGWAGFGLEFLRHKPRGARSAGVVAVPMGGVSSGRPVVAGLVSEINGAHVGSTFAGYCDAVRTIGSGQTAVLTIQTRPNHAPEQVQVKFL
ncbi:MAG: putative serine protease PepD [Thermoleophilaceae bacterium]|jgi:putative serine protease PepD|nr:putative serine protease PepD [Thermoleophilaceae bacterium]